MYIFTFNCSSEKESLRTEILLYFSKISPNGTLTIRSFTVFHKSLFNHPVQAPNSLSGNTKKIDTSNKNAIFFAIFIFRLYHEKCN